MSDNNKHSNSSEKLPATSKTCDKGDPSNQDPFITQIGSCFEKFADKLGQHISTLGTHISNNIIEAINTSENQRIDKEEVAKKRAHSSRAKANEEEEEHTSRRKRQKLGTVSCRDKSQIQEQRKVRNEVSKRKEDLLSEVSSEDEHSYSQNGDRDDDCISIPSEEDMAGKMKELHSSL